MRWHAGRHRLQRLLGRVGTTRLGVLASGRVVCRCSVGSTAGRGGRLSLTGRAPVLLLTTVGRRTETERTVPVFYLRDGDHLVVCNQNPGFAHPNPWILDLRAERRARVQVGSTVLDVVARAATAAELDRYWPRLVEVWPAYREFYHRGRCAISVRARPSSRAFGLRAGQDLVKVGGVGGQDIDDSCRYR